MRTSVTFLVLISTSLLLGRGVPILDPSVLKNLTSNSGDGNTSETLSTVPVATVGTTTPPPTPSQSDDEEEVTQSENVDEEPSTETKREEAHRVKSPTLLLYEVERGIRTLSLQAIEFVLSLGNEVFSYSLADALGYLKNQNEDDPHVKVIEDNKEILIRKLKDRREELKPSRKPPPPTTAPPQPPDTAPPVDVKRIKYDIVKNITKLTVDRIDVLLKDFDEHTLPFALGIELGYDDERDVEHFQYLEDEGGEKLKKILVEKKQKMLTEPRPSPSKNTNIAKVNKGNAKDPTVDDSSRSGGIKLKKTKDNEVGGQDSRIGVPSRDREVKPKKTNDDEPGGQEEEGTAEVGKDDDQHPPSSESDDLPEWEEGGEDPDFAFRGSEGEQTRRLYGNNQGSNHPPDVDDNNRNDNANGGDEGTNAGKNTGPGIDGDINKEGDNDESKFNQGPGPGEDGNQDKNAGQGMKAGGASSKEGEGRDGGGGDHGGERKDGGGGDKGGEGKDDGRHREEEKDEGQGTMY